MRTRYIALMATLAASLLSAPTASACSLNPTAIISAPSAASSQIHGTAVGFNGSTSTANCGTIIGYLWKNGSTTLSTSPTFNYTVTLAPEQVDSVITVSLKVTSSYNARTHTVYRTITIKRDHQSQYFVKDHLGSPRVVVDGKGTVLSYTDYYPFGMVMPGRAGNISLSNDRVKFTGYLLEEEGDQDTYHAEARGYDPVIGRFTSRDPYTSEYPNLSPYSYVANNPLLYTDPTGKYIVDSNGNRVEVTTTQDEDGNYVNSYTFTEGTEQSVIDDFHSNGGVILGAMAFTEEGRTQLGNLVNAEHSIGLTLSNETMIFREDGQTIIRYGITRMNLVEQDDGSFTTDHAQITVYKGTAQIIAGQPNQLSGDNGLRQQSGVLGIIGQTGVNEAVHATNPLNMTQVGQNVLYNAGHNVERDPNAAGLRYTRQLLKLINK